MGIYQGYNCGFHPIIGLVTIAWCLWCVVCGVLFLKENRNLWNDNMVYQSIHNCQRNATNRRRREKEEQFIEQQSMMQATTEAIELPHDNL